jgi:cytochrome P450
LIDAFPGGDFDLLDAFCRPIPVIVIARLLGVPEAMAPDLLRWSNAMVMMYQAGRSRAQEDEAVGATIEFVAFMRGYIDRRRSRAARRPDLGPDRGGGGRRAADHGRDDHDLHPAAERGP